MDDPDPVTERVPEARGQGSWTKSIRRALVGAPRNLSDSSLFHRISLIPILAWVGLGADGLSSSAYGPEEAFLALGSHTYLAVVLAAMMCATVLIISSAYSRIIEEFPHGGGGYVVATKLLGQKAGLVSGAALVVDYVLTIAISVAAAGDAIFSFLPLEWQGYKLAAELGAILALATLNIRGVKESVLVLTPVFMLFLVTHVALLGMAVFGKAEAMPGIAAEVQHGLGQGLATLGVMGLLLTLVHAFSLGGGTYTGIEAVSNGLPIMRDPKVKTGKRTMAYMAGSLAITASGLLLCYLLWDVSRVEGQTLNAVLATQVMGGTPWGMTLVGLTLFSEGALLIVAAQAGFLDGPRVLGNMAVDSWVPHRLSALSDRLTTQNGILLMGGAALAALVYTLGDVRHLVVMYSVNVFITFSLSMLAMMLAWARRRGIRPHWKRRTALFALGFALCATILAVTVTEKFKQGAWVTLAVTGSLVALCMWIHRHYRHTAEALRALYAQLAATPIPANPGNRALDPARPTAAIMVATYGGLGLHTLFNVVRMFPGHFHNVLFLSVGVIDSGAFKGEHAMEELRANTEREMGRYLAVARGLGLAADVRVALGTDAADEAAQLCLRVAAEFPAITFFAGKVIFKRERWYQRLLHNETAYSVQRRLQWAGQPMVIVPAKVA